MTTSRHRRTSQGVPRRAQILIFFVVAMVILASVSLATRSTATVAPAPVALGQIASTGAQSSSFTCGGLGEGSGPGHGVIILANGTQSPRIATVSLFDDGGHAGTFLVGVKSASTVVVDPGSLVTGGTWIAASIEISGGGVGVVEQLPRSNSAATPCVAATSTSWGFVGGSTQVDQTYDISLVNPTATSAVVNTSFLTDGGEVAPQNAQGVVVTPHSVVVLSGLDLVPHSADLGAIVTASQGSIAAFATQIVPSPNGASVTAGQPTLERDAVISRAVSSPSTQAAIVIGNPTPEAQSVVIDLQLPSGAVSPQSQVIAPYSSYLDVTDPSTRVPQGIVYSASIHATGPGVTVSLSTQVSGGSPGSWGNVVASSQASMASMRWLLVGGLGTAPLGASFTNLSDHAVTIHVAAVTPTLDQAVGGVDGVTIPVNGSLGLSTQVLALMASHSLEITSSAPLAISEDLPGGAAPSVGNLLALPQIGS